MRPSVLVRNEQLHWTIRLFDPSDGVTLIDADSVPSIAVRKNGAAIADSVTVVKRASSTGVYDCMYDPSGEVEGDGFTIEETAIIAAVVYENDFSVTVTEIERGTDNASMFDHTADHVTVSSILADVITAAVIDDTAGAEIASTVEAAIVNEGDATAVMTAIADRIASDWIAGDASPLAIVSAMLANPTIAQALGNMDITVSSRQATVDIPDEVWSHTSRTLTGGLSNVTVADYATGLSPAEALANGVALVDNAISAAKFDESTAFPLKQVDSGDSELARKGSAEKDLTDLSNEIAMIAGSGSSGPWQLDLTFRDSSDNSALQSAEVYLMEGVSVFFGTTNTSGLVQFNLPSTVTVFKVIVHKVGYSFPATTYTVSGDDQEHTFSVPKNPSVEQGEPIYTNKALMEKMFGKDNVERWGNIDNLVLEAADETPEAVALALANQEKVDARIALHCFLAEEETHQRLEGGPYEVPFDNTLDMRSKTVVCGYAAYLLYDARGAFEFSGSDESKHALSMYRTRWSQWIKELRGHKRQLEDQEPSVPITSIPAT